MKEIIVMLTCYFLAFHAYPWPFSKSLPKAKVTVRVVDGSGSPVEGADIGVGFDLEKGDWVSPYGGGKK